MAFDPDFAAEAKWRAEISKSGADVVTIIAIYFRDITERNNIKEEAKLELLHRLELFFMEVMAEVPKRDRSRANDLREKISLEIERIENQDVAFDPDGGSPEFPWVNENSAMDSMTRQDLIKMVYNEIPETINTYGKIHETTIAEKEGLGLSIERLGMGKIGLILQGRSLEDEDRNLILKYLVFGKGNIFRFWNESNPQQKKKLLNQLRTIDLELTERLYKRHIIDGIRDVGFEVRQESITVPKIADLTKRDTAENLEAQKIGIEASKSGEFAVLETAGGTGSRFNYEHPKSLFPVSQIMNKPLARMRAEKIRAIADKYGKPVRWILMTSDVDNNHDEIVEFFKKNIKNGKYFNQVPVEWVEFKKQSVLPQISDKGEFILNKDKDGIVVGAFGHGDARDCVLKDPAILNWLTKHGVKYVLLVQNDNAFLAHETALGHHIMATKDARPGTEKVSWIAVEKTDPKEKVGMGGLVDGKMTYIEYNQIPQYVKYIYSLDNKLVVFLKKGAGYTVVPLEELKANYAEEIKDDKWVDENLCTKGASAARLWLNLGMINQQIWSLDSFSDIEHPLKDLPVDATRGKRIKGGGYDPETGEFRDDENFTAAKFETFDFQGFFVGDLQGAFILNDRPGQFAPIKNPDSAGDDCPVTAKALYNEYEKSFFTKRGAEVSGDATVESTPAYAYLDGTGLDEKVEGRAKTGKNWKIKGTAKFYASGKYTTIGDGFEIEDGGEFILDVEDEYNKNTKPRIGNNVHVKEGVKVSIKIEGSGSLIIDDGFEFDESATYVVGDREILHLEKELKDKGLALKALQRFVHFKTYLDEGIITEKEYNNYVHHRFITAKTFIKIRKSQGLSERAARREIADLEILDIFMPDFLGEGEKKQKGYSISLKFTDHEINSLSENTQKLLNRGSISEALEKGTIIKPEIINARLEIADIVTKDIRGTAEGRKKMRDIEHDKLIAPHRIPRHITPISEGSVAADIHKNERVNRIRYYVRANRFAPKQIFNPTYAINLILQWYASHHDIVPFEFGGTEGMSRSEAIRAIAEGGADLFTANTSEVFLKIRPRFFSASKVLKSVLGFLQDSNRPGRAMLCERLVYGTDREDERLNDLEAWRVLLGEIVVSESAKSKAGENSEMASLVKLLLANETLLKDVVGKFSELRDGMLAASPNIKRNGLLVTKLISRKLDTAETPEIKELLIDKILENRYNSLVDLFSKYELDYLFDGWLKLGLDEKINLVYDIERIGLRKEEVLSKIQKINYNRSHKISLFSKQGYVVPRLADLKKGISQDIVSDGSYEKLKKFFGSVSIDTISSELETHRSALQKTGNML